MGIGRILGKAVAGAAGSAAQVLEERRKNLARLEEQNRDQKFTADENQKQRAARLEELKAEAIRTRSKANSALTAELKTREKLWTEFEAAGGVDPETGKAKAWADAGAKAQSLGVALDLYARPVGSAASTISRGSEDEQDAVVNVIEEQAKGGAFGRKQGEAAALDMKNAKDWKVARGWLVDSLPGLSEEMKKSPKSTMSSLIQNAYATVAGATEGMDAQALLDQYAEIAIQGIPYSPGAQSDKEFYSRRDILANKLTDPKYDTKTKVKLIGEFIEWQDNRAEASIAAAKEILGTTSADLVGKKYNADEDEDEEYNSLKSEFSDLFR